MTTAGMDAYAGFGGRVARTLAASEPWWPPRPSAAGKPNVVVMLADDLGFSDIGCFGSEIPTPHLDRLAADGVQLTNFHVAPMCSPTRASLLTGRNHHAVGFGTVANSDPGFPGFTMNLPDDSVTMPEAFRAAGYSTLAVGKWHLCREVDMHDAGSRASWPCQRGFDRFYGFLEGLTNQHHPHRLISDNSAVEVDSYPDDYYLTDDLTDRAISMIRASRAADPTKPFLLYFGHAAVHAPLQAKAVDIERHRGRYQAGWDELRRQRHARQLELGIFPPGTELAPRNHEPQHDVGAWDDLSPEQQELFARYMEVYAAMVDNIDQNLGRLRADLEAQGIWDDTIVVFTSDNGGSKEGGAFGTTRYMSALSFTGAGDGTGDHERLDLVGGPQVLAHYPRGWAMASNTPFRLYKINTHAGGHQVPTIVSWPAGLAARGVRRSQYAYVTDLFPTLAELAGVTIPTERNGQPAKSIDGVSFRPVLADENAPAVRTEQYYEMTGHRGYYCDGYQIVSFHQRATSFGDHEWELYDLRTDPTELHNLAAERPELVQDLAERWERAAWDNCVFPLDEGVGLRGVLREERPELTVPVTLLPGTPTLERARSQALIAHRSFVVTASLDHRSTDRGILLAHGDQGGGYALYIDDGRLWWAHNNLGDLTVLDGGALPEGHLVVTADVHCPAIGRWQLTLTIGDDTRITDHALTAPVGMAPFEGIDVGCDRRSPVHWQLAQREGTFPYTGNLHHVRFEPGAHAPDAPHLRLAELRELGLRYE